MQVTILGRHMSLPVFPNLQKQLSSLVLMCSSVQQTVISQTCVPHSEMKSQRKGAATGQAHSIALYTKMTPFLRVQGTNN